MSTNKTKNYGLHAWEPGDDFLRSEFNENFEKLDGAARIVAGTFKGDGTKYGDSQFIDLGFTPKAVFAITQNGATYYNMHIYGGLALPGHPIYYDDNLPGLEIVEGGFRAYYYGPGNHCCYINYENTVIHYLAFR